ncbi:hypothetical protein TRVL_06301 [Trypanosoma vivax]|nr:hypothetical protein TRVL_06301 [Trypanosoma vivax]
MLAALDSLGKTTIKMSQLARDAAQRRDSPWRPEKASTKRVKSAFQQGGSNNGTHSRTQRGATQNNQKSSEAKRRRQALTVAALSAHAWLQYTDMSERKRWRDTKGTQKRTRAQARSLGQGRR